MVVKIFGEKKTLQAQAIFFSSLFIYRAHRAVVFAIAHLSCNECVLCVCMKGADVDRRMHVHVRFDMCLLATISTSFRQDARSRSDR